MKKSKLLKILNENKKLKIRVWCPITCLDGEFFKVNRKDFLEKIESYDDSELDDIKVDNKTIDGFIFIGE